MDGFKILQDSLRGKYIGIPVTFKGEYDTLPTDLSRFNVGDGIVVNGDAYILEGILNQTFKKGWSMLDGHNTYEQNEDYSKDDITVEDLSMVI